MNLNEVHEGINKRRRRKRIGRGTGSGSGKTSGRGHKGQRSRSGASFHPQFQGGAMPMFRRIPKRGFNNSFRQLVCVVNVSQLNQWFDSGDDVDPDSLSAFTNGKSRTQVVKILGDGNLEIKLNVSAHRFSQSAREKIEKAGGTIVELPAKSAGVKNEQKSKSTAED